MIIDMRHFLSHGLRLKVGSRSDALGIEIYPLPKENPHNDDGQVVHHAFPAGHILQQTSAAADEKIGPEKGFQDGPYAKPGHRVDPKGR